MKTNPRVLIATPASGGMVTAAYTNALFNIVSSFRDQRPDTNFSLQMTTGTDLHVMRNFFAAKFMSESSFTHLLFIDSDTIISPKLVARLLDFDKPLVGSLVPFRSLDHGRLIARAGSASSGEQLLSLSLNYVAAEDLIPLQTDTEFPQFQSSKGFVRTRRIGTGVMLMKREVLTSMEKEFPDLLISGNDYYSRMGHTGPVLQCFSPLQSDDGTFFSEDMSFCERWSRIGGEIWVCVDENVSHIGPYAFTGRYVDRLERGLFQSG